VQRPIINIDEVELQPRPAQFAPKGAAAERFEARVGMIAPKLGAQALGYIGDAVYPIRRGDIIACPPGGKETAHQIVNTGKSELKYLAVSTKRAPEICDYPDSGKFAVMSEGLRFIGRENQQLDYWEGE
jgi:hypothetical protein